MRAVQVICELVLVKHGLPIEVPVCHVRHRVVGRRTLKAV